MIRAILAVAVALAPSLAAAAVPETLSFTARISDGGAPASGAHGFAFKLYAGESVVWEEGQISLAVIDGVVAHQLGSTVPLTDDVLARGPLALELIVDGVVMAPRLALTSVPYARAAAVAHRVPRADREPAPCDAAHAGALYFDSAAARFLGCDGSSYVELGPRLPTRYTDKASTAVAFPNTDSSCAVSAGSPWTDVTGMRVSFTAARETEIELGFSGSIVDDGQITQNLHCALRFLVDGQVVAQGNQHFGHYLWSNGTWGWVPTGTARRVTVPRGTHNVTVQGRSGLCNSSGDLVNLCRIPQDSYPEISLALEVLVP